MQKQILILLPPLFLTLNTTAKTLPIDRIEKIQNVAKIKLPEKNDLDIDRTFSPSVPIPINEANTLEVTEMLLNQALQARQFDVVKTLLGIYQRFPQKDENLYLFAQGALEQAEQHYSIAIKTYRQLLAKNPDLNPVRIELAKALFLDKQDSNARQQFQQAKAAEDVPPVIIQLIDGYLNALDERAGWQTSFSAYYLNERNVNNTSSARNIENTSFMKGDGMLPQSAHGFAYNASIERDFNLINAHYLHVETAFNGKSYWDNHDYDDLYNRSYLGYSHKSAKQNFSLLPFYERRWYGDHRYNWGNGVRAEYQCWLSPNWQINTALEWGKQRYFESLNQNGTNKLASATLLWLRNPKQYFYLGADINRERTQMKQYGSNIKGLRIGWGQEWEYGISTRVNAGISQRYFKDKAVLGGILPLGKVRKDVIYNASITLWKRDWHLFGITPKLQATWKKQDSNLDSLYSYSEKQVRLVLETNF